METYQKFHEDVLKAYEEWRAFRSGATGFYFQDLTRYAVEDWSQKYWEKKPNTIKIGIVLVRPTPNTSRLPTVRKKYAKL